MPCAAQTLVETLSLDHLLTTRQIPRTARESAVLRDDGWSG